ncbi:hypothetical protein HDV57DRAFT_283782 [Trichoderma longibrachiatum]|uniref:Uncharacterized protein n=1 Tax=Trichoderma longibrachiatum ATCC 18648 TaxID=983965 RepID=A0A2T4CDM3_TRILO|nr:hypothetical protein M440DRAFT_1175044 [Trichoderma longibrachiatum ATCC 18648]
MCCLVAASCSYGNPRRKCLCQSIIGMAALWMVGDSSARGSWLPSGTRPLADPLPAVSLQSATKTSPARSCSLALGLTRLALLQYRGGLPNAAVLGGLAWPSPHLSGLKARREPSAGVRPPLRSTYPSLYASPPPPATNRNGCQLAFPRIGAIVGFLCPGVRREPIR